MQTLVSDGCATSLLLDRHHLPPAFADCEEIWWIAELE
jgi:hypothetical protein